MIEIVRKEPVNNPVIKIKLELTPEQIIFLRMILRKIGGPPRDSARKYADQITELLERVDVPCENFMLTGEGINCPLGSHDVILRLAKQW